MRKVYYTLYITIPLLAGVFALLGWNTLRQYRFERKQLQEIVDQGVKNAADSVQNYNGSLLNTYASSLTDSNYERKLAFAAGFTHNIGKVEIPLDDDSDARYHQPPGQSPPPPVFTKKFFAEHHITYDPRKVMNTHHFDSVFRKQLQKSDAIVPYVIRKARRFTSPKGDTIISAQFILEFTRPVIYNVLYTIPRWLVLSHMMAYLVATLLTCLFLVGGAIFLYRSLRLQIQMSQFRESLLGNITHELKTPLSSLQLIIDSAAKDISSQATVTVPSKHIVYAETELKRMKLLVERMLSFSKMNKEQLTLDKQQTNLADVIKDALLIMEIKIQQSGAVIQCETSGSIGILADPLLLTNAVAAIIDNAIKYCNTTPAILISLSQTGRFCTIAVQDNGIGIPRQYRKKIFAPFFRVPSGNIYQVPGHGLGLSFVKQVAELHGGNVYFTSHEQGTTFYLRLSAA